MEDIEAPPNKCQKTECCNYDTSKEEYNTITNVPVFEGYHVQILEAGIGKARSDLFRKKINELGGTLCSSVSEHPNVLIVDENMTVDRLYRLLKIEEPQQLESVTVVKSLWLSDCIKSRKLLPTENCELRLSTSCTVSATKTNLSTLQQPRSLADTIPDAVPGCTYVSTPYLKEDSDAGSNYTASGGEDAEDDASETKIMQLKPLPVCFVLYLLDHVFYTRSMPLFHLFVSVCHMQICVHNTVHSIRDLMDSESDGIRHFLRNPESIGYLKSDRVIQNFCFGPTLQV